MSYTMNYDGPEYPAPYLEKPHLELDCLHKLEKYIIYGELDWKKNKQKRIEKMLWWKDNNRERRMEKLRRRKKNETLDNKSDI